jgi:hypothetical protein
MVLSGFISGLAAQSELTQLLDEIYGGSNDLLDELCNGNGLNSLDKAEQDKNTALYVEVASIWG